MFFPQAEGKEVKIIAWVGEYYPPAKRDPFSTFKLPKAGKNRNQKSAIKTAQQLQAELDAADRQNKEIEARLDAELDYFKPVGSVKREKTAISRDQLEWRDARNTTCKTIFRGHVVDHSYSYKDENGELVTRKNIYRDGSVRKYVRHDSHGFHGRKPRYKDVQSSKFRVKHLRDANGELLAVL